MFHFQEEEWTFQQVEDYSNQVDFTIFLVCLEEVGIENYCKFESKAQSRVLMLFL